MRSYNIDLAILGGGPAGMSAAIYAARNNLSTAIIDTNIIGGKPCNYLNIDNYLGYPNINGYELSQKFEEHLNKYNIIKFQMENIKNIDLYSSPKIIKCNDKIFNAKSVILACGANAKKLNIKGEYEFISRGVSYCAICDGMFYKDKIVTVVGGGNSALEEAMYLTKFAKEVYIIHRHDLKADKIIQDKTKLNNKIKFLPYCCIKSINGDNFVKSITLENMMTHQKFNIQTDGVFIYIGYSANTSLIIGQLKHDSNGFIVTDNTMQTSIEGVFAVGDIRNTPLRQVITAVSDGAIASIYASKYVENQKLILK